MQINIDVPCIKRFGSVSRHAIRLLGKYLKRTDRFEFTICAIVCFLLCIAVNSGYGAEYAYDLLDSNKLANVDKNSGAATHVIPIEVPPGRNGLAPSINLVYNSLNRNGWVGVGWSIDMGAIQRSTKSLDYQGDDFVVVSSGARTELVAVGNNEYKAKIENAFSRYYLNPSTDGWEVTSKDGTVYYYGATTDDRQINTHGTFKWCLSRILDTNGNYIQFTYEKDEANGEIYLDEIQYTGNTYAADGEPKNVVKFIREVRGDAPPSYTTHSRVVTTDRLKTIDIVANGQRARVYRLWYDLSESTERSLLNRIQQYGTDAELNPDGLGEVIEGAPLPDISFDWSPAENYFSDKKEWMQENGFSYPLLEGKKPYKYMVPMDMNTDGKFDLVIRPDLNGNIDFQILLSSENKFEHSESSPSFEPMLIMGTTGQPDMDIDSMFRILDANGDGLKDVVIGPDANGRWQVATNSGTGFNNAKIWIDGALSEYHHSSHIHNVYPMDFDGDGDEDIVLGPKDGEWHLLRSTGAGLSFINEGNIYEGGDSTGICVVANTLAPGTAMRYLTHPMDVTGDGLPDLVLGPDCNGDWFVFKNTGTGFYKEEPWITGKYADWSGVDLYNNKLRPFNTDVNGDGLQDMVIGPHPGNSNIYVLLSTGYSFFDADVWGNIPGINLCGGYYEAIIGPKLVHFDSSFHYLVHPMDVNGDGLQDFVFGPSASGEWAVLRSTGSSFEYDGPWINEASTDWVCRGEYARAMDVNGDGRQDIVLGPDPDTAETFVLMAGGSETLPDLLTKVENGLGGVTEIQYTPSSKYTQARLPFIVHTVSQIEVDDGVVDGSDIKSKSTYAFEGGLYDSENREFRGFSVSKQTNPNNTFIETKFHQSEYLKGRPEYAITRESVEENSNTINRSDFLWNTPQDQQQADSRFVYLDQKNIQVYENGQLAVETQTNYTYDDVGNILTEATISPTDDAEDIIKTRTYVNYGNADHPTWRLTMEQTEGSETGLTSRSDYRYSTYPRANLQEKELWHVEGANPVVRYHYDYEDPESSGEYGNLVKEWDARRNPEQDTPTATYTYDAATNTYVETNTNALGHTTYTLWDDRIGKEIAITDANNVRTNHAYDAYGRLTQTDVLDSSGNLAARTLIEYHWDVTPHYTLTRVLETNDPVASYVDSYEYFDGLQRPIQTTRMGVREENQQPVITRTFYDNMGRVTDTWGPYFGLEVTYPSSPVDGGVPITHTDYDLRSRPEVVTTKDTRYPDLSTTYTYEGLSTTVTDPGGSAKKTVRDYLGRTTAVVEYADSGELTTTYLYNAADDLVEVRNALWDEGLPDLNRIVMTYDTLGRKISMQDPDLGNWQYGYDANGNMAWQIDAKNQEIRWTYDALDRVESKTYVNGSLDDNDVSYTYDDPAITLDNPVGHLSRVSNGVVTTTYAGYDAMGRQTRVSRTISGDSTTYATEYVYDLAGKPTTTVYPDLYELNYTYYPGTGIQKEVIGATDLINHVTFTDFTADAKITKTVFNSSQIETSRIYDLLSSRLTNITTGIPGNAPLMDREYSYYEAGNIETIDDAVASNTRFFEYDKLHRLKKEYSSSDNYRQLTPSVLTYAYDETGENPLHAAVAIDNLGTSHAFGYDDNGNMTTGFDLTQSDTPQARSIEYNMDNMPVRITHAGSGTTALSYDEGSNRVKKTTGTNTTYYLGPHCEIENGQMIKYLFAGDNRVAMIKGGETYYFHKDHLGSSTLMTDSVGNVDEATNYLPYGGTYGADDITVTNYKFTDQEHDRSIGLYNYEARLYDPVIGRFVSADSIVPDWYDPQSLDRYAYCLNNPIKYTDPSGHFAISGPSLALYLLLTKIGALSVSWGGVQAATHIALATDGIDQPISTGYLVGNKIWSGALEVNRVPLQIALESTYWPDKIVDGSSAFFGWDFTSIRVGSDGHFTIDRMTGAERAMLGMLISNSYKYDKLSDFYGNAKSLKRISKIYDSIEAISSISESVKRTDIMGNYDMKVDTSFTNFNFSSYNFSNHYDSGYNHIDFDYNDYDSDLDYVW